jgi:hypothetical protein
MIKAHEIKDGLVLCLDPDELEANGGGSDTTDSIRVQGAHFFVCIAANEQTGNWVPLFSAPGRLRILFPNDEKSGHPKWCESETYFHGEQIWQAPHAAVVAASIAGGDLSGPGSRITLTETGVNLVYNTAVSE